VAQHSLDLLAALLLQDLAEPLEGEVVGQRVGAEGGDAGDLERVADQVDRQPLLGAGLGDVEAGLVVEDDAGRQRVLAAAAASGPRRASGSSRRGRGG
jgi:hypothetical protein